MWGAVWGECIKTPLTHNEWHDHLYGQGSVGVYPLCEGDVVKFGCVDIDDGEDLIAEAINVWRALKALGITAWVERTKSKGFHIWVFVADWVSAEDMRAALYVACQLVDYRPKEVNPKAAHLRPGFISNYVNLPYAKKWADGGKRVVLVPGIWDGHMFLDNFLDRAEENLTPPAVIAQAASLHKPPPPPKAVAIGKPNRNAPERLRGVARALYEDGPLPNLTTGRIDRSAALQRLAHLLRQDGFDPSDAYWLVADLDSRMDPPKYTFRADADVQYRKIIERAWA